MTQTSCKRLVLLFINLMLFVFITRAQDSSKITPPAAKAVSPAAKAAPKSPLKARSTPVQVPAAATPVTVKAVTKPSPTAPSDNSLNGLYEDLLKHSWMQQGYKVVNPVRLTALWKSVNDSLNANKKLLVQAKQKLNDQEKLLAQFKNQNDSKISSPQQAKAPVSQIELLGMTIDVTVYNSIVWGLIFLLGAGLTIVLFTISKSSHEAKHHKQLFDDISSEYQSYKVKAKEKEQKLARELQTERNTIEDLLAQKNENAQPAKR